GAAVPVPRVARPARRPVVQHRPEVDPHDQVDRMGSAGVALDRPRHVEDRRREFRPPFAFHRCSPLAKGCKNSMDANRAWRKGLWRWRIKFSRFVLRQTHALTLRALAGCLKRRKFLQAARAATPMASGGDAETGITRRPTPPVHPCDPETSRPLIGPFI